MYKKSDFFFFNAGLSQQKLSNTIQYQGGKIVSYFLLTYTYNRAGTPKVAAKLMIFNLNYQI